MISKKQQFLRKCNEEIRLGRSFKEYLAVVNGNWPESIITGRTHQIRVQTSSEGYSIVGDSKYGKRELNKKYNQFQRMFLHSFKLNIPNLNVMIESKEPEEFKKILKFDETL